MGIKISIHKTQRHYTDGVETIEVKGKTVGECIEALVQKFPGIEESLFDSRGKLLSVVEIYLNMESAYPDELAKPVKNGDEIHITLMLAGG